MNDRNLPDSAPHSSEESGELMNREQIGEFRDRKGIFWAARNRILLWYGLILAMIFVAVIPAFRSLLSQRVSERVQHDMIEKMATFDALIEGKTNDTIEGSHWSERQDDRIRKPTSSQELAEFFDVYLSRQVPEDDVFLIAILDGRFYKSSPRGRPELLKRDGALMKRWARQTIAKQGREEAGELGQLLYVTRPIWLNGELAGVFVLALSLIHI